MNAPKTLLHALVFFISMMEVVAAAAQGSQRIPDYNVIWDSLGINENSSMPLGNGDLAANVWTEQNGDLLLLLSKSDAWSESGNLLKLGRVRIHLDVNPFLGQSGFAQVLHLENGSIELSKNGNQLLVWVDANQPVIHIEAHLKRKSGLQARLELWRPMQQVTDQTLNNGVASTWAAKSDIVFSSGPNRLNWCYYNSSSVYPEILQQQHLETLIGKFPDPLKNRCFGASISGSGLMLAGNQVLQSQSPNTNYALHITALTQTDAASPQQWKSSMDALLSLQASSNLSIAWHAHQQWWNDFWNRSWIHIDGHASAKKVSQGYAIQRFMVACSSRGAFPVKFNGGLFTVGHDMSPQSKETAENHSPDYRTWGEAYWNQNNRLMYWPLLESGDFDLLKPWFDLYLHQLPFEAARNQIYHGHPGASYPETMYFFGLPRVQDFGMNNPSHVIQNKYIRHHVQGALETALHMLTYYDYTGDTTFVRASVVPFANAILEFYYFHYPHMPDGKIQITPAQSLETYQIQAINPTPDIAGLKAVLPRLLALPEQLTSDAQRKFWIRMLNALPPIPLGQTTAGGKLPISGKGDPTGLPTILPAEEYGKAGNVENPELYVAFPYELYGVGKPALTIAQNAYHARRAPQNTCWGQDGPQAAVLGLTEEAQKAVVNAFTSYGSQKFVWFWRPGHDWIPDLDNGGTGMITLEKMLMQTDGKKIRLVPAWPQEWTADFKLHAPYNTTLEGHIENGKISNLKVFPVERTKDVIMD